MVNVGKKLHDFLKSPMDLDRAMPLEALMPHFNKLPFDTQRMMVESQNTGRGYKPVDVRKYPNLQNSGVQLDPHRQKVCPVCFMVLQRTAIRKFFGGCCPKCGCRLQF